MRAYFIRITKNGDPNTVLALYTSFKPDGSTNGAALQIEMDIPVYAYGDPSGGARIKVFGVNYADIRASKDFNDQDITIYGGMAKGLPLANPAQAGVLLQGTIFQAYGNAMGGDVSLEMIVYPKAVSNENPANISYTWKRGDTLQAAVTEVLKIAFPGSIITGSFSDSLVYTEDQDFAYKTLSQFATQVLRASRAIITDKAYRGAQIVATASGFRLFDGMQTQKTPKQIAAVDLVGQPTWLDAGTMQFSVIMRADLNVGDIIQLPDKAVAINTPNSFTRFRDTLAFQGLFQIRAIRHLGASRSNQAQAWVTIVDCYVAQAGGTT